MCSKWFLKKTGHEGLNNLLAAYSDKTAFAQCTFAFCEGKGQPVKLFKGVTNGTIVPARGPPDFGWDPIFQPEGFQLTYAEMESGVKNTISHRYKALCALRDYLTGGGKEGEGGVWEEGDTNTKRAKLV
ncbi:Inosine triphosphate pyrophosphatase [Geodia barretti]|uniref:Inosine triphosphate pyrophosphatase n=1 Tax=Geodia barretti TaxID=519541 RepID=A0AA35X368_GEOBA|nr:Inosine triphosphate pyrophosphatase [Geodia barretti]